MNTSLDIDRVANDESAPRPHANQQSPYLPPRALGAPLRKTVRGANSRIAESMAQALSRSFAQCCSRVPAPWHFASALQGAVSFVRFEQLFVRRRIVAEMFAGTCANDRSQCEVGARAMCSVTVCSTSNTCRAGSAMADQRVRRVHLTSGRRGVARHGVRARCGTDVDPGNARELRTKRRCHSRREVRARGIAGRAKGQHYNPCIAS